MSYQKKDVPFFWNDNDKDLKVCFLVTHLTYDHILHEHRWDKKITYKETLFITLGTEPARWMMFLSIVYGE